jgi:phosphate transport system permease protein
VSTSTLVLVLLILVAVAYRLGRARSLAVVGGSRAQRNLHSLPSYYGMLAAMWCGLPALLVVAIWNLGQDAVISQLVVQHMPRSSVSC